MTITAAPSSAGPLRPDRLQKRALTALIRQVGDGGRAVLVMPCGSGKTLVSRWLAERVDSQLTVVSVPTLALLPQTLKAWRLDGSAWAHRSMIVGSEPANGRVVALDDLALPGWAREEVQATTSTAAICEFLRQPGRRVIFSTYHSAPRVAEALGLIGMVADLLVCDEAHRLCGQPRSEFRVVLDEEEFPARRRLAMTATPVEVAAWTDDLGDAYVDGLSLDDITRFGPVAYRASFADAVEAGRLVDYDVHVLARPAAEEGEDSRKVNAGAAVLAAAEAGATRILTFHTRVSRSLDLAGHLYGHELPDGKRIRAVYLESAHNAQERQDVLDLLRAPAPDEVVVVCSARVLSEGVDVPAVDTVVFADPRSSSVDIVQAAGRAMRTAPGKTRGRIVLTVDLGDATGLDDDSRFALSKWRHVWHVLRVLASMDPRFRREMTRRDKRESPPGHPKGPKLAAMLPDGWDAEQWKLHALDRSGALWWERYRELEQFATRHGHARPSMPRETRLAPWVTRQRALWYDGLLEEDRARALERLPGWVWDGRDTGWWRCWQAWQDWAASCGVRPDGGGWWHALAAVPVRGARTRHKTLADFAVDTAARHRSGDLAANLQRAAEQLPGWQWDVLPADDAAMVDALAEYAVLNQHAAVPPGYLHDSWLRLGDWVTSVRRRRYTGRISVPLERALDMLSARLVAQGIPKFSWEVGDTGWRLGYLALRQFQAREGHCRPPYQHVEALPDIEINLSRWCVVQRQQYRLGEMSPQRIAALTTVPGWQWEVDLRPGYRPVLDGEDHGSRTAYNKGCRCPECTDVNAGYEHARTNGQETTLVDAGPARAHVRILRGLGASQRAIARAAGLGVKTIGQLEDDVPDGTPSASLAQRPREGSLRIQPETESAVLAVTIAQARRCEKPGLWGGREPAGPTLALVAEMVALGYPRSWIAHEIGQEGPGLQIGRSGYVGMTTSHAIRQLRQQVGSMRAPAWGGRTACPPLDELLAARDQEQGG